MAQVTIHVLPRPYQARIENGLLARAGSLLAESEVSTTADHFIVTANSRGCTRERGSNS